MTRFFNILAGCLFGCLVGGSLFASSLNAQESELPAFVQITLPADAKLTVDGVPVMSQTGEVRKLRTPFLPVGKQYAYTFKATFTRDGKEVVVEKKVLLEPGRETNVDLTKPDAIRDPKKVDPKKEDPKKVDPKKEDPKKEDPKKVDPKKEDPKKEDPKKVDPKKEDPKKEAPKKVDPKKEDPKKEDPKKVEPKKEVKLDVPYVPTPDVVVDAMLKLAKVTDKDVVYDLGCGDGRIVITAVKQYKAKKGLGIELAPERVKLSKENAQKAGVADKVEIREGSVLDLKDVSEASVITLYLFPEINLKLMPILKKTLKPGSRIVSHDFDMGDWKPEKEINVQVQGDRDHTVYLWVIPDPNKKSDDIPMPREVGEKKEEPKKVEPKKEEPKKVEPKKEEPKKPVKKDETIKVPYVPTPQQVVEKMLDLAKVKEGDVVFDLGCGDGRIVVTAVKKYKAKRGWGVDLDPERVKDSEAAAKAAGIQDKVKFEQGDVLKITDVSEANVVTLYLLPEVNRRLKPMLLKTLKPGARVVSHDFDMGDDWKPEKTIDVIDEDGFEHKIYLWTIPAKK